MNIRTLKDTSNISSHNIHCLLVSPQYKPNLSNAIRTAEFYGLKEIFVYDQHDLLKDPKNKKERADRNKMARVWTAGASEYIHLIVVNQLRDFLEMYNGRKIATILDDQATELNQFKFEQNDLIIFGNEKDGISEEIHDLINHKIMIRSKGQTNCLNMSTSFGIFLHNAIENLKL